MMTESQEERAYRVALDEVATERDEAQAKLDRIREWAEGMQKHPLRDDTDWARVSAANEVLSLLNEDKP